jgi:hypothetical protein
MVGARGNFEGEDFFSGVSIRGLIMSYDRNLKRESWEEENICIMLNHHDGHNFRWRLSRATLIRVFTYLSFAPTCCGCVRWGYPMPIAYARRHSKTAGTSSLPSKSRNTLRLDPIDHSLVARGFRNVALS